MKFLDPDKPGWQQALALELLHRLTVQPALLREFCRCYDCRPHATNIFQVPQLAQGHFHPDAADTGSVQIRAFVLDPGWNK